MDYVATSRRSSSHVSTPRVEDIPEVADDELLIRHLDPRYHWDWKEQRPSLGAFKSDEVSIDRENMRSLDVSQALRPSDFGFARFPVDIPRRELGLQVVKDPMVPDEPEPIDPEPSLLYNPGHAHILNVKRTSHARRMRDAAEVLQPCTRVMDEQTPHAATSG
jgi:hypothetical protein